MESQVIWRAQSQVNLRKVATEPFISQHSRTCGRCHQQLGHLNWCQTCQVARFKKNFPLWTSGKPIIDEFIRETQLKATSESRYLQWIQYDLLEDVQFVAEGGFGCIYSANWSYNAPERLWKRGSSRVALKSIKNSVNATEEFLRELKLYWESTNSCGHIPHCYGMTKNFKNEYMMVLEYAEDGNLRQYLQKTTKPIAWGICRKMLRQIAKGLKTIHRADLIHRDLHSGNILVYKDHQNLQKGQNKKYLAIGDLGLCHPADLPYNSENIYGVLPFMAPEALQGKPHTKAVDIYGFAMIMWELASGKSPFGDRPHDASLAIEICDGLRPDIPTGAPAQYIELMKECWDPDPLKRPDADEIIVIIEGWSYLTSSSPSSSSISFGVGSSESLYDSPVRSRNNSVFTDNSGDIYEADSFASDTSSIISEFSLAKIKKKRNILGTIRRIVRKDKTKRANEISKMQKDIITEMTAYTYCPTHKNALPVWNQRLHSEAFYTSRLLNFPELRNTNRKLGNKISKEGTCLSTTTATAIPSIVLGTSVNSDCGNELQSVDAGLEDIFANFRLGV